MYQIDEAMLGGEFNPPNPESAKLYLRTMAQCLTNWGYGTEAVTDSYNGALSGDDEIPTDIWNRAQQYADEQFAETFWSVAR